MKNTNTASEASKKAKRKKTLLITVLVVILALPVFYWIGTGLRKAPTDYLANYTVSEDGTQITLKISSWSSIGYTRGFRDKKKDTAHYLTFYATFGGINSKFGAKNEFVLELDKEDTEIYFFTTEGYQLVLKKNKETMLWEEIHDR